MKRLFGRMEPSHLLVLAMSVVAATSFHGVMRGPLLIPLAAGGAAVALIATLVADRLKFLTAEWAALAIIGMALFGGPAAGTIPSPSSYGDFFGGLINGWADLLSSVPPVELAGEYRVLPYVIAWLSASIGFVLLRHLRFPGVAALGPLGGFSMGLLFSTEVRSVALIQGALLAALALALGFYQQRDQGFEDDHELGNTTIASKRTRLLGAGGILLLVAGLSPVLAPAVPGFENRERFDLRDRLDPPWNPLDEPSPLAQIRGNFLDKKKDEVVFVASGSVIPDRWTLATLAAYDGTVWTVGDSGTGGAAPFLPIDLNTPVDPWITTDQTPIQVDIEIIELDGPWLPTPGRLSEITITDPGADTPEVRFNQRTGTAAAPGGAKGLSYSVLAVPSAATTADGPQTVTWGEAGNQALEQQPGSVVDQSADVVEGVDEGWETIQAIADSLIDRGFYLATKESRPGHSWARLSDFSDDETLYGNEEQYAAMAAIMARNAHVPARVVVGYDLSGSGPLTGEVEVIRDQASAWIEVLTVEFGWIPVDVTPPRDKEPSLEDSGTRLEPVAAPNPPPPPPPPPEIEAEAPDELDEEEDDELEPVEDDEGFPQLAVAAIGVTTLPLGTFALWTGTVVALKARKRRKRRQGKEPSDRIAGAWFEANDRVNETGLRRQPNLSVIEQARSIDPMLGGEAAASDRQLESLALAVDQAAFASSAATPDDAEAAWVSCDHVVSGLASDTSFFKRILRKANPTALLKRDPSRKASD